MKKVIMTLQILIVCALLLSVTQPAMACWLPTVPFEVYSDDGSRVFVFVPDEGASDAHAAVYEVVNNARKLVYTVEGLSSFAYESNFHFSNDLNHFIRTFPAPGIPAFEVFSYGIRTRVVLRSDFIENYASEDAYTSIGPQYTINWRIEENPSYNNTVIISTDEDSILVFEIATATFNTEDVLVADDANDLNIQPQPIYDEILKGGRIVFQLDFIHVINRTHPDEPLKLHIGDEFQGFTLERIEYIPFTSSYPEPIVGHFTNELVVTGTLQSLSGCSTSPGIYAFIFWPDEAYYATFPQFYPSNPESRVGFTFYGVRNILELLDLSEQDMRAVENETIRNIRAEGVAFRIGNFSVSNRNPTGRFEVLEVLSIESLNLTRQFRGEYIFFSIAALIFVTGVSLGTLKYIKWKQGKRERN